MEIKKVLFTPGRTGSYYDDQAAIKSGANRDGLFYRGRPVTAGFRQIRQPGESISITLILEDGQVAVGDCAAVQYSGLTMWKHNRFDYRFGSVNNCLHRFFCPIETEGMRYKHAWINKTFFQEMVRDREVNSRLREGRP